MQAIFTRYLPATRHLPERIQATTHGFNKSIPIPEGKNEYDLDVHLEAMQNIALVFNMRGSVTIGDTPTGFAFVFLDESDIYSVPHVELPYTLDETCLNNIEYNTDDLI